MKSAEQILILLCGGMFPEDSDFMDEIDFIIKGIFQARIKALQLATITELNMEYT